MDVDGDWLRIELPASELAADRDVPEKRMLPSLLQDAVRAYNSKGAPFICDHFDTYLSLIINGQNIEWAIVNKGFEYVERGCQQLCGYLEDIFKEKDIEHDVRTYSLNCLKMYLYLLTGLMKLKDSKLAAEMAASLNIGKRGKKSASVDRETETEWRENERRAALDVIYNLLQLPLHRLWDPPLADDAFVDLVAQPCYRMMEDQIIRSKTTRETVFQILGILNKKYNHGLSCTIKLMQMVQLYEHAILPICAGVHQLVTVWSLTGLVGRLVRELGETLGNSGNDEGVNMDSAPIQRNCAMFLSELTQLMPGQMIPAAQAMRSYLENDECYPLRSSVLGMMCEIICSELKGEGLTEEKKTIRNEFLDDLEDHIHDLSAYVRAKVLQFWGRLQKEGCVPITRQQRILDQAIGRLQDRATIVRKSAVQLIKLFLEHNPFSARLTLSHIENQLNSEKAILETMQQKLRIAPNSALCSKWEEIEDDVKSEVANKLAQATQDDPPLSQNLNDAYAAIRSCLEEKKYQETVAIIRFTEKQFPEAKLLRSEMNKDDQVAYIVSVLRNVFITEVELQLETPGKESESLALIKQYEEKENVVAFLEDCLSFSKLIQKSIPLVYTLLISKQSTDVNEAIDFFTTAHNFNIETSDMGTMGMLQLVWSPDQEKRDAVEHAYRQIYFNSEGNSVRARAAITAKSLVKLVQSVNQGQAAALEALLARWLKDGHLCNNVIQIFWEMFTMKHEGTSENDSYAALSLLVMISKAKPSVASANVEIIQTVGLTGSYQKKLLSTQLLLSMAQNQTRLPVTNTIFTILSKNLIEMFFTSKKFAAFGTATVNVVYSLCDTPDLICIEWLSKISQKLDKEFKQENESGVISLPIEYIERFLVLVGHIAMRQLTHLDVTVYGELRRRNEVREQRKAITIKSKVAGKKNADGTLNCSSASAAGRIQQLQNQSTASVAPGEEPEEDEMGLEGAVADDADAEFVRMVCEKEVVYGGLLSKVGPILRSLLEKPTSQIPEELRASACLTLGRFMLVSSTFCEENMQLLMTLLKNATCSTMRSNIVITLADLTLRFPNIIQPWTHHIYERLEDPCVEVRQCTVKMLSFLILQEMVRVRGQVAGLARCCVDSDLNIRTMARAFFKQLSQKGNSLYNVIPDIISRLSDTNLELPEDQFRSILKYVMSLIQKDRQMEALVEKLCLRFKLSNDERQWRDLAYCLSLFTYNDRSIKKLMENMDCYKDKLFSKEVYNCFKTIINNTNKMAKAELKATVAELNERIEEIFSIKEGHENQSNEDDNPRPKVQLTPKQKKAASNRRARARKSSSDESDDDSTNTINTVRSKESASARTPLRKRVVRKYNDEDDDDENDSDPDTFIKKKPQPKDVFKKPLDKVYRKRK